MKHYRYLIVGGGLAGDLLGEHPADRRDPDGRPLLEDPEGRRHLRAGVG